MAKVKRNVPRGVRKRKREQAKLKEQAEKLAVASQPSELSDKELKQQELARQKAEKEKQKQAEAKKKQKEREKNPGFWDKVTNYLKTTTSELKKTQWLDATELNKATGSVFAIVSVFTIITWIVDTGLGGIAALILDLGL